MTPAPPPQNPPQNFIARWDTHPHSGAFTAAEAWRCKRYQDQWKEARREPQEHWWDR
jgi:hypothetical protein